MGRGCKIMLCPGYVPNNLGTLLPRSDVQNAIEPFVITDEVGFARFCQFQ